MKIKSPKCIFLLKKELLINSMKIFIFIFCTSVFGFMPKNGFSQKTKIVIDSNMSITVDEVFELIIKQSKYSFIYHESLFENSPKVHLKKGIILISELLESTLNTGDYVFEFTDDKRIILKKTEAKLTPVIKEQQKEIKGKVSDENGSPLPGVSIKIVGTNKGAQTNFDGNYSLNANIEDVLEFSYLGMKTVRVTVSTSDTIDVTLEEDASALDEIVLVGYGSIRKSDLTGSVSSVKAKDITASPAANIENALQGKSAGVFVTSASGVPGGGASIRIRGGNSVTAGNEPLYVIDGFIGGGDLNSINTQDIASIEVLKDASATAIYGARGANGVILITTKRGNENGGFSFESYVGVQKIPNLIDMLDGQGYAELVNEARAATGESPIYANPSSIGIGTNWQDEITRSGLTRSRTLSFNGGSENTKSFVSASYYDQEGVIKESGYNRYQLRTNIDHKVNDYFKLGTTLNISYGKSENIKTSLSDVLRLNPVDPVYDTEGNYNFEDSFSGANFTNPVANNDLISDKTISKRTLVSVFGEIKLLEGLSFRPTFSADVSDVERKRYEPSTLPLSLLNNRGGDALMDESESTRIITEGLLNYNKNINDNNRIDAVLGVTYQRDRNSFKSIEANNLFTDVTLFNAVQLADKDQVSARSGSGGRQILSFLGRVNYSLNNKYIFTVTGRRDGSSVFGENNKWANFAAGAIGWNLKKESFMADSDVFDTFKFRMSYGQTGNQGIAPFQTLGALSSNLAVFGGVEYVGLTQTRLPNPDLKWEKTDQFNVGLELGFLDNRLKLEIDYYKKNTSNLLLDVDLPFQVGFTSQLRNVGAVENQGFELLASMNIINKEDFGFDMSFNISTNKNQVVSLSEGVDQIIIGRSSLPELNATSVLTPGQPIGVFLGLDYLGTWKDQAEIDASNLDPSQKSGLKPGDQKYGDYNGDTFIDSGDEHVIGNPTPKLFGGLNANIRYKNFDLGLYFYGSYGNDLYYREWNDHAYSDTRSNNLAIVGNRWTPTNNEAYLPRVDAIQHIRSSTADVHDGSYLRLKTLRIGYDVPLKSELINNLNIYFSGNNLFLIKSKEFVGYDPEVNFVPAGGSSTQYRGFYSADYPQSRTFLLGLKLDL